MARWRALLVAVFAFLVSCGSPKLAESGKTPVASSGGRTVLLVTIEAWRAGPNRLPAFESNGVALSDVATVAPMARPALAAIHTGVAPDRLGVRDDFGDRLSSEADSLAARFDGAGWQTAAFVGSPTAGLSSGLQRGFRIFDASEDLLVGPTRFYPKSRPAAELAGNLAAWLTALAPAESAFCWVHLADLTVPATKGDVTSAAAEYEKARGAVEAALGQLEQSLTVARRLETADVIVVGTHGILLGEGGARGASYWLQDETLRVPMIVAGPIAKGLDASRRTSVLDVAPALAAAAGLPPLVGAEGVALGDPAASTRVRRAWSWAPDDDNAWPTLTASERDGTWTVTSWPEARSLERPATPRSRALSPETVRRLSDVGVRADSTNDRPSPPLNDRNEFLGELTAARHLIAQDRTKLALDALRSMEARWPGQLAVATHRLFLLSAINGRDLESVRTAALRTFPLRPEALHWAAHADFARKEFARAELLVQASAEIGPADADHYYDLACARSIAGDADRALEFLAKAVEAGYRNWDWMGKDPDLASVRADSRFAELLRSHGR